MKPSAHRTPRALTSHWALALALAAACSPSDAAPGESGGADTTGADPAETTAADGGTADTTTATPEPSAVGRCEYTSAFTGGAECREYVGDGWTDADVLAQCEQLTGTATLDAACADDGGLGVCVLGSGTDQETRIVVYGDDASTCATQQTGCEVFAQGVWEPAAACEGETGEPVDPPEGTVFEQPTLNCVDPLPGEPAGLSEGGQVCTWQMISAATEPGRQFVDYASCDVVRTQRPYYAAPPPTGHDDPDPRLDEPTYVAELAWVRGEVEASACVCCHAESAAPEGPSIWFVDAPGNWMNSFYPSGLAFAGGIVDSSAFGAYPAEQNNGFHRDTTGLPSTDPERMRAFFLAEFAHRGLDASDFADAPPVGGPLVDQLAYEPGPCTNGEGVDADGTIMWTGGDARYVYVLEADARSPTVPPNLDLPDGTLWRIDVPSDGDPVRSGEVVFGDIPSGTTQRVPATGVPPALVPGTSYYLYASRDVLVPVTRCVFTY